MTGDPVRFGLQREEVSTTDMPTPCFLISHPEGILLWDTGSVPDEAWTATGNPVAHHLALPDGSVTVRFDERGRIAGIAATARPVAPPARDPEPGAAGPDARAPGADTAVDPVPALDAPEPDAPGTETPEPDAPGAEAPRRADPPPETRRRSWFRRA